MFVIRTSRINPQDELQNELKKFTKHFKKLHSKTLVPSPGQRWMDYIKSIGAIRVLDSCKNYMGGDDDVVIDRVNNELIAIGDRLHKYTHNETLDRFFPDYYIKKFLMDFLNATSWDTVNENTKKICYKGYPTRTLPDWNKIAI